MENTFLYKEHSLSMDFFKGPRDARRVQFIIYVNMCVCVCVCVCVQNQLAASANQRKGAGT